MPFPQRGDVWERLAPPTKKDVVHLTQDPRFLKFCQVGASVEVTDVWKHNPADRAVWVDARCGGDTVIFQQKLFVRAYGRASVGNVPPSPIFHDVREWEPGDKLNDIPLLKCPACGKTAFDIGTSLDYLGRPSGKERTYVHIVSGLTDRSGTPVLACNWAPK